MNLSSVNNLNFGQFVEIRKNVFVNTENIKHIYRNDNNTTIYLKDNFMENIDIPYDTFMKNINNNQSSSNPNGKFVELNNGESIHVNNIMKISEDQFGYATVEAIGGTNHYSNKKLSDFILDSSRKIKTQFINLKGKNISNILMNVGVKEYNEVYKDK